MTSNQDIIDALRSPSAYYFAGACWMLATIFSSVHVYHHLGSFSHPKQQTQIIRILFMVPVYSCGAFLSLTFPEHELAFDSFKDCYEAVTIYSFLQLLLAYIGGESAACVHFREKAAMSTPVPCCCLAPLALDHHFLRRCKQWVIQFVFVKPIMAAAVIIMENLGIYGKDSYRINGGFLYVQVVYNISYTLALYGLGMFYNSSKEILAPYHPVKKFAMVKAVVFLSFWQGFLLSIVGNISELVAAFAKLQSLLICVEMFLAAGLHCGAFPASEYYDIPTAFGDGDEYGYDWTSSALGGHSGTTSMSENLASVLNVNDVVNDAYNNYSGRYTEYALQSDVAPACEVLETVVPQTSNGHKAGSASPPNTPPSPQPSEIVQGCTSLKLASMGAHVAEIKPGLMQHRRPARSRPIFTRRALSATSLQDYKAQTGDEFGEFEFCAFSPAHSETEVQWADDEASLESLRDTNEHMAIACSDPEIGRGEAADPEAQLEANPLQVDAPSTSRSRQNSKTDDLLELQGGRRNCMSSNLASRSRKLSL